jgi:hypothetical protein
MFRNLVVQILKILPCPAFLRNFTRNNTGKLALYDTHTSIALAMISGSPSRWYTDLIATIEYVLNRRRAKFASLLLS